MVPSVRVIREALKRIPGAVRDEPTTEDSVEGSDPATLVQYFDPETQNIDAQSVNAHPGTRDLDAFGTPHQPTVFFEVPPSLTDAEVKNTLGDGPGDLRRKAQLNGIDAYGWYVSFHRQSVQHGVYLPIEGIFAFALDVLADIALPFERKLQIAFHAILRHELFHFETDCMTANWELATGEELYWWGHLAGAHEELEEALSNAYMLRGFRYPDGASRNAGGCYRALTALCELQPAGYRDGPRYASSRPTYIAGCRELSLAFHSAPPRYEGDWEPPAAALDTSIFYPNPVRIDWRRCPILIHDSLGLLKTLGIQFSFFEAISGIFESQSFLKSLRKLGPDIGSMWRRRKADLTRSVGLASIAFKRWKPGGRNCYSVRVNGSYRVHLRHDTIRNLWIAERIGDHKSMGHG